MNREKIRGCVVEMHGRITTKRSKPRLWVVAIGENATNLVCRNLLSRKNQLAEELVADPAADGVVGVYTTDVLLADFAADVEYAMDEMDRLNLALDGTDPRRGGGLGGWDPVRGHACDNYDPQSRYVLAR